jgi:hypothetical protein
MQLVDCTVHLHGSPLHTVRKRGVPVPEVILLRAIHGGDDTVVDIEYAGDREDYDVLDELMRNYGSKEETVKTIRDLFPGANPGMPKDVSVLGLSLPSDDEKMNIYRGSQAQAAADSEARAKAARADKRQVVGPDEDLIPPPPPRGKLGVKAAAAALA